MASEDPEDRTRLKKLAELVKSYAGVVGELAVAARDYGDTVDKVKRGNALGKEIDLLLGTTTEALIAAAGERKAKANAQAVTVSRIALGLGVFVIAVLAGVAIFGAVAISRPIRHIGEVLLELARGNRDVEVPYTERRDEVGDNARAAETFKEKLIRIEQLEAAGRKPSAVAPSSAKPTCGRSLTFWEQGGRRCARRVVVIDRTRSRSRSASSTTAGSTRELSGKSCRHPRKPRRTSDRSRPRPSSSSPRSPKSTGKCEIDPDRGRSRGASGEDRRPHRRTDRRSRPHRRRREADYRHRRTDQPARAQCHDRSRPRRRGRPRLCRGRARGQGAGGADFEGDRGDRRAHRRRAIGNTGFGAIIKEIGTTIGRISGVAAAITSAVDLQAATTEEIAENVRAATGSAAHVTANIAEVDAATVSITAASAQVLASAQTLAQEGNRLAAEMEKFLAAVCAA